MNDKDIIRELKLEVKILREEAASTLPVFHGSIPVFHGDKILIVKLKSENDAVFEIGLKGDVIAECNNADDATYILDFIN